MISFNPSNGSVSETIITIWNKKKWKIIYINLVKVL